MKPVIHPLLIALLVGGCTGAGNDHLGPGDWRAISPDETPWTIKVPPDWHASTDVFEPGPRSRVSVVTTAVATAPFRADSTSPHPHSRPGASDDLGRTAAVVIAKLLWVAGHDRRNPPPDAKLTARPVSRWHNDVQNPGWVSRERNLCKGSLCISILEWHGPEASSDDVARMALIASTIRLAND